MLVKLLPNIENRILKIDTLRGIACVFLVAYHVIGNVPEAGLKVDEHSIWRIFAYIFVYSSLPLFAFISGYVYMQFSAKDHSFKKPYTDKLRRLGLPLISVSTLFFLASVIVGTAYAMPLAEIYKIYLFSYAHYWYLQASLLIFALVIAMNKLSLIETKRNIALFFAGSVIVCILSDDLNPDLFSINGAIYLLPFFSFGLLLAKYRPVFSSPQKILIAASALLLLTYFCLAKSGILRSPFPVHKDDLFGITLSLALCLTFFALKVENKYIAIMGGFSYTIYLFHIFATSATRMAMIKIPMTFSLGEMFAGGLILGVALPIFLHLIIVRNKYLNLILLGEKLPRSRTS